MAFNSTLCFSSSGYAAAKQSLSSRRQLSISLILCHLLRSVLVSSMFHRGATKWIAQRQSSLGSNSLINTICMALLGNFTPLEAPQLPSKQCMGVPCPIVLSGTGSCSLPG